MPSLPFSLISLAKEQQATPHQSQYVGRFAPSPSGPLHFGSLIAALGSYLQAKANQGLWLVRIEDIDPPREIPGAADDILRTLALFGLHWDGPVLYQSSRHSSYRKVLAWLSQQHLTYACQCTRKQINQEAKYPGVYNGRCKSLNLAPQGCAIRLDNQHPVREFTDSLQGKITSPLASQYSDDFIIHRKDGLFAYQLAVVIDDIAQGISEIVRGSDLLTTSLNQITLYKTFGHTPPSYLHLPVAISANGKKLSKQNHATAIDANQVTPLLIQALKFLNHPPPATLANAHHQTLIQWAIEHWSINNLPKKIEIESNF